MSPARTLRYSSISFLLGVLVASALLEVWRMPLILFVVLASIAAAHFFIFPKKYVFIVLAAFFGVWYCGFRYSTVVNHTLPTGMDHQGMVQAVDYYPDMLRLRVTDGGVSYYLSTGRLSPAAIGDRITYSCHLEAIEDFEGFAYTKYAAAQRVIGKCRASTVSIVNHQTAIPALLFRLKVWYANLFREYLHEPESALARAMTLADQRELPVEVTNAFSRSGASHIIAISGLNITIIVIAFEYFLTFLGLPRGLRLLVNGSAIILFLALLGFPASAVRAGIFGIIVLSSRVVGRSLSALHAVIVSAGVMALVTPLAVAYDPGFQLSFMAFVSLLATDTWWQRHLTWLPEFGGLRSVVTATMSAQTLSVPLLVYYFHLFSLVAVIVNIILIPLVLPVVLFSFLFWLAPLPFIGNMFIWPLYFLLRIMIEATGFAGNLPFAAIPIPPFSAWWLVAVYAGMALLGALFHYKKIYAQKV